MKKRLFVILLSFSFILLKAQSLSRITDICFGSCSGVRNIGSYNGIIYFAALTPSNSVGLWKTDGTIAGTMLIKEVSPSFTSAYNYFTEGPVTSSGLFFFGASASGTNGYCLWRSDGTASGTYTLTGITNPTNIIELNGFVVFLGGNSTDGHGGELWRSDGTVAGTYMIKDIYPGQTSGLGYLYYEGVLNNKLFFPANDGVHGQELWVSDGTSAGTFMVKDLNAGSGDGYFQRPIVYNGFMYYCGNSNITGSGVYKSAGVFNDPVKVLNISWLETPSIINNLLYFSASDGSCGYELYKSDGTQAQTSLVKDINPGAANSFPTFITSINNKLFFKADNGMNGIEPWISDGTNAGTIMIKDINPGSATGCYASSFRSANNKVYFIGEDPTFGREIWETDGTATGTIAYDIKPGTNGANPFINRSYNNELYLVANDGITGSELWKIGGSIIGFNELDNNNQFIKIYPNPNNGLFIIDSEIDSNIIVTNILGENVLNQKIHKGKNDINLSFLMNGIYFIKNLNSTIKIIKK